MNVSKSLILLDTDVFGFTLAQVAPSAWGYLWNTQSKPNDQQCHRMLTYAPNFYCWYRCYCCCASNNYIQIDFILIYSLRPLFFSYILTVQPFSAFILWRFQFALYYWTSCQPGPVPNTTSPFHSFISCKLDTYLCFKTGSRNISER